MASIDNLSYNKPCGFEEVMEDDCFEDKPKLKKILNCGGNQLLAYDGSFVIFNMFHSTYTRQSENDQMIIVGPPRHKSEFTPERYYMFYVKHDLIQALSKEDAPQWKDHLLYYSEEETTNKFNADIAFSYTIPLEPEDYYKEEYNNLWVLFLTKYGGFLRMYCFYKDMPKKKSAEYKARIEGTFNYKS
jgi:hypothetical protein